MTRPNRSAAIALTVMFIALCGGCGGRDHAKGIVGAGGAGAAGSGGAGGGELGAGGATPDGGAAGASVTTGLAGRGSVGIPSAGSTGSFGGGGATGGAAACSTTMCGGVCVDLANDPGNCGRCGRTCLGRSCSASGCEPLTISTLAEEGRTIDGLAAGTDALYAILTEGPSSTVYRVSPTGGTAPRLSLVGERISSLATDGTYIYSVGSSSGLTSRVSRLPIVGDQLIVLATLPGASTSLLRVGPTHVFASVDGRIVERIGKAGESHAPLVTLPVGSDALGDVEVADGALYYVLRADSRIMRLPWTGGTAATFATGEAGEQIQRLVPAAGEVLFSSDRRVGRASPGVPAVTLDAAPDVYVLIADGTAAYYVRNVGRASNCADGSTIHRIPIAGGAPLQLATETGGCIGDLVQDATALYWVSGDRRSLRKISK